MQSAERVSLVTVFTTYNSSIGSRPVDLVTVGKMSYDRVERSLAVLNVFVNFIQVYLVLDLLFQGILFISHRGVIA